MPMRTLYLLRHAKSSWSDSTLADRERPLAPRGRRDAKRMSEHLVRSGVEPGLVLCSPAVRTRETLERLGGALGSPVSVQYAEELYAASWTDLLERLHDVPETVASVMLIGHNPGLEDLALALASSGPELARLEAKFPTGALATLTATATWQELSEGDAVLTAFVVPRELD
jgi:phosphohistidine phosphatase